MGKPVYVPLICAGAFSCLCACIEPPSDSGEEFRAAPEAPPGLVAAGEDKFDTPFAETNGRACGDCHIEGESRALPIEAVADLLANDPDHPLFADIDADVLGSEGDERSFNNLAHGLARVLLPLPDNMDVIDLAGNVVTPPDRMIEVWRAVPSIDNTSYTGPYLHDGRAETLEAQALGAIEGHSQNERAIGKGPLEQIAAFERTQFSSDRAKFVHDQIEAGVAPEDVPNPEDDPAFLATLTPAQLHGKQVYDAACTPCHGGATDDVIVNRVALASLCFDFDAKGNLIFDFTDLDDDGLFDADGPEALTLTIALADGCGEFMPIGTAVGSALAQLGLAIEPLAFNRTATLPRYRFRFYKDDARTIHWTDLPPVPVFDPQGNPAVDERGLPIVGPAGVPQFFTTDPGRALITGNPSDFEAFDVPQLRGIANTGPYFHDNLMLTLDDVVETYSRAILPAIPALGFLPIHPTEQPSFFAGESLSEQEKANLIEFLEIF